VQDTQFFFSSLKAQKSKKYFINKSFDSDKTTTAVACEMLNCELLKVFLENGADPNAVVNDDKDTLLHRVVIYSSDEASEDEKIAVVKVLLSAGAKISLQDNSGCMAWQYANLETENNLYKLLGGHDSNEAGVSDIEPQAIQEDIAIMPKSRKKVLRNRSIYNSAPLEPSPLRKVVSAQVPVNFADLSLKPEAKNVTESEAAQIERDDLSIKK